MTEQTELEKRLETMRFLRSIFGEEARRKTGEAGAAVRRAAEIELACAEIEAEIKDGEKNENC